MSDQHDLEPLVHDWLHRTLDTIPDPSHRYGLVASEVNETDQQPRWLPHFDTGRFTMFSALKAVAAAAIVGLFGGLLLVGVLTAPDGDVPAPAADTESASSVVKPGMSEDPSTGVTGVVDIGTDDYTYQTTEEGVPPLDFTVYNRVKTTKVELDDPRLSGELLSNRTLRRYDSGVYVGTGIGRLTNEGGSWDVAIHSLWDPEMAGRQVIYLTGAEGYEGLHAVLLKRPGGAVDGVVVPAPWPEPPEELPPPAE